MQRARSCAHPLDALGNVPRRAAYDGSKIAVLPIRETLPPVHVMSLRLRRQAMRPAVRTFAEYMREAFLPGGLFHQPGPVPKAGVPGTAP